ncbi:flavodoxin family protein [Candidatus Peregrinibacteria bacterium]|nr:flavodoxin family protein [Candidatus Peregrinibacteria bacterium]
MSSIHIVYASVGGNTQMVVETVADLLKSKGHRVSSMRAELSDPKALLDCDVCVLASPTYGHGTLEAAMDEFVHKMKGLKLGGKPCAVIGLGDAKYELQYHLESAPKLEKVLTEAGGKVLLPALRISGTPVMHLKGLIPAWVEKFSAALK